MKDLCRRFLAYLLSVAIMLASSGVAVSQTPTAPAPAAQAPTAKVATDPCLPWPRTVTSQGATISIYQPQVDSWSGNVLKAYAAVKVKTAGKKATDYGVIWFTAKTEVDKVNRVVTLYSFDITPEFSQPAPTTAAYASALTGELPWSPTIALFAGERVWPSLPTRGPRRLTPYRTIRRASYDSTTPAVLALDESRNSFRA